jgi:hypothetical protein
MGDPFIAVGACDCCISSVKDGLGGSAFVVDMAFGLAADWQADRIYNPRIINIKSRCNFMAFLLIHIASLPFFEGQPQVYV